VALRRRTSWWWEADRWLTRRAARRARPRVLARLADGFLEVAIAVGIAGFVACYLLAAALSLEVL
jgi:hypothetical protein